MDEIGEQDHHAILYPHRKVVDGAASPRIEVRAVIRRGIEQVEDALQQRLQRRAART